MSAATTGGVHATRERVERALDGLAAEFLPANDGTLTVRLSCDEVKRALAALRDRAGFEQLLFVTAVDRLDVQEPRFDVVWELRSYQHRDLVRVHAAVDEVQASVATVTDLWPGAAYGERECFDMFGIRFDGHAGLKRLLMPDEFEHFPLRKDFPHGGIDPGKLYREWDKKRRVGFRP